MHNDELNHVETDSAAPGSPRNYALVETLRQLLFADPEFAMKKYEDHRRFTAIFIGILAVFLPSLWGWDYLTDPGLPHSECIFPTA
jgi:hypothetical protein